MSDFEVMTAKTYKAGKIKNWQHYRVEPKLDGVRVICMVKSRRTIADVKFYSRNGRELDMFSHLADDARLIYNRIRESHDGYDDGMMLDGEMCDSTFNEIGGAIHRKDHTQKTATFHAFFVMPLKHLKFGVDEVPQYERRLQLDRMLRYLKTRGTGSILGVHSIQITSDKEVSKLYRSLLCDGFEGAMLKDMEQPWTAKRSSAWQKIKESNTEDLPIVGWKPGKGKYAGTVGAVLVNRKGKSVSVSGMDDDMRDWLFANRKQVMSGKLVAEIEFQKVTVHGSLRHPRFIKLRRDKEKT